VYAERLPILFLNPLNGIPNPYNPKAVLKTVSLNDSPPIILNLMITMNNLLNIMNIIIFFKGNVGCYN